MAETNMIDQDSELEMENKLDDLTNRQQDLKSQAKIHRILDKLFKIYSESEDFKTKFSLEGYENRSLLLTIVKEPLQGIDIHEVAITAYNSRDAVRFGARYHDGKVERYMPEDLTKFTVQCIMDQDIFIDLLLGKDKYGNPFDINDAWGRKWIGFEGENWLIHKEILTEMFNEFRYMLNIKTLLK